MEIIKKTFDAAEAKELSTEALEKAKANARAKAETMWPGILLKIREVAEQGGFYYVANEIDPTNIQLVRAVENLAKGLGFTIADEGRLLRICW